MAPIDQERLRDPRLLPGGEWVIFGATATDSVGDQARVSMQSLNSGDREGLDLFGRGPRYVATGHLVYARDNALLAVPFDPVARRLEGGEVSLEEMGGSFQVNTGSPQYSVTHDGTLVYLARTSSEYRLVLVDRNGRELGPVSDRSIENPRYIRFSPDGSRLALSAGSASAANVWIYPLDRTRPPVPVTNEAHNITPVWSPDGRSLVIASNRMSIQNLLRVPAAPDAAEPDRLLPREERQAAWDFTPDGRELVYGVAWNLLALPLDGDRIPRVISELPAAEGYARMSPDQQWLAYDSTRSGRREVWMARYPDGSEARQVSTAGGAEPVFSPDGRELYYIERPSGSLTDVLVAVAIETSPRPADRRPP